VKLIARQGSPAPGTAGNFQQYLAAGGILFLNNHGEVAFAATPSEPVTGTSGTGIWTTAPDGVPKLIAREGDYLDIGGGQSKQIRSLSFAPGGGGGAGTSRSFNDAGQIVFHAWFTDNSQGIFLATPPPVLTGINVSGSSVNLSLRSAGGWVYSIDSADSLPAVTWIPFITNLAGTGYIITAPGPGGGPDIRVFSGRADVLQGN
jgi:hypothetical protein